MMDQVVPECTKLAGFRLAASGAGPGFNALFRTGRFCGRCPVAPVMAKDVCYHCFSAEFCSAGCAVDHFVVAAVLCTVRTILILPYRCAGGMASCRKLLISRIAAPGAGVVCVPAGFHAGRRFGLMMKQIMSQSSSLAGLCLAAAGAGPDLNTRLRTSRFRCHRPFVPFMAKGFGFHCDSAELRSADRTADDLVVAAFFRAGGFFFIFMYRCPGCMACRCDLCIG